MVALTIALALAGNWFRLWMFRDEIVKAFLREHLCPSCGYDLTGATPQANGLCLCPECSAAWKLRS